MEEMSQVDLFISGQEKLHRAAEEQVVKDREARIAAFKARRVSRQTQDEIAKAQQLATPEEEIEIPPDWKNLLAAEKRAIADALNARDGLPPVANATEAAVVIDAEMARRAGG